MILVICNQYTTACVGAHVMHDKVCWLEKVAPCLSLLYWSRCCPSEWPVAAGFWLRMQLWWMDCCILWGRCVVDLSLWINSCMLICVCLLHTYKRSQASIAGTEARKNICTMQNDHTPFLWQLFSRSILAICSLVQNNHAHSRCVVRQSFQSNSLRKST